MCCCERAEALIAPEEATGILLHDYVYIPVGNTQRQDFALDKIAAIRIGEMAFFLHFCTLAGLGY